MLTILFHYTIRYLLLSFKIMSIIKIWSCTWAIIQTAWVLEGKSRGSGRAFTTGSRGAPRLLINYFCFNVHLLSEKDWKLPRWRDQFVLQVKQDHRARWVRWLDQRILVGVLKSVDHKKRILIGDLNQMTIKCTNLQDICIGRKFGTAEYAATCESMLYSM